jgi:photosystem II stability/assembly factor-like uncharacterized protein
MRSFIIFIVLFAAMPAIQAQWVKQPVNSTAAFRGLSVVNEKVVWASGTGGTVIRTVDGGKTWDVITVPGAEKLDFRDIEAFDAKTAYILSIGNGADSRIYKTVDGGKTWKEQFRNANEKAFFDAIACLDRRICIAMSDPVDEKFLLISTFDGWDSWKFRDEMPSAREGEAAFAASGTCLTWPNADGVFLVSGGSTARVHRGTMPGDTFNLAWSVSNPTFASGSSGSGIFSIAMLDKNGVIVGGNYEKPTEAKDNLALTTDGGATWKPGTGLNGYRSGVAFIDRKTLIAVGTNGTDISNDRGGTWKKVGDENLNAVAAKGKKAVWAVGPKGLVVRLK